MAGSRYVVLGLAHVRSPWSTEVTRWATAGSVPVEFVKCLSAEELRARLASGRPHSAALLDARLAAVDRDLLALAAAHRCPTLVVAGDVERDWPSLGASAVIGLPLTRTDLLDALQEHASPISRVEQVTLPVDEQPVTAGFRGRLVAVTGRGGTGRSTVAIALAQGLAADARYSGNVCLVDACLHGDHAVLHDARDVVPGVQELVEAHRGGNPSPESVRSLTFDVPDRGYALLLGLRRHRDWTVVRPRAWEAALAGLCGSYRAVVADVDADLEGEADSGSFDVEDRNALSRVAVRAADVVVAVGRPTLTGLHGLLTTVADVRALTPDTPVLAVINAAPRSARNRAELTRAFADLAASDSEQVIGPVFVGERRGVDDLHRDAARLPSTLTAPLAGAVHAVLDRAVEAKPVATAPEPTRITPGSLGAWAEDEEATS